MLSTLFVDSAFQGIPVGSQSQPYNTIQAAINAASAGDVVDVAAGIYREDVTVNKRLSLIGADAATTIIEGPIGGVSANTLTVAANQVLVRNFTITRAGNNATDWNDPSLNSQGLYFNQALTSGTVEYCRITGNRNGVYLNSVQNIQLLHDVIDNNRTGVQMVRNVDGTVIEDSDISYNWTVGVLFNFDGVGTVTSNVTISHDAIHDNWYGGVVRRWTTSTAILNVGGNWLGTTAPVTSNVNTSEPAYNVQIPVEYGGTAVNPGGAPDIVNVDANNRIDYGPWLESGASTPGVMGFEGDFSSLIVGPAVPQWSGSPGTIQEGVEELDHGGALHLSAGTYTLEADVVLGKSITLLGPNVGISPRAGGAGRGAEAIVDGGATTFTGSSGYGFALQADFTSLDVEGLTFTHFDGALFDAPLTSVVSVELSSDVFTANNGALFIKSDSSVATAFVVSDDLIANQSMTGVDTAVFRLHNVVSGQFDDNEATAVSGRELFAIYDSLGDATFNDNALNMTGGLVGIFGGVAGSVEVARNDVRATTSSTSGRGSITFDVGSGQTIGGVTIEDNAIDRVLNGDGLVLATDGGGSIRDVIIRGNTIGHVAGYGIRLAASAGDAAGSAMTGSITGITIDSNAFADGAGSPILASAEVNAGFVNSLTDLVVRGNTFAFDAGLLECAVLIDLRNLGGESELSGNELTLRGVLPAADEAVSAIGVRGGRTGRIRIADNRLDGGGVARRNGSTVFVTGIEVDSHDVATGALLSSAAVDIANNTITGFEDGVAARDRVQGLFGNLPAGIHVTVVENDLSGNSLTGVRGGATGSLLDASDNWWGSFRGPTTTANPGGDGAGVGPGVRFSPWIGLYTDGGAAGQLGFHPVEVTHYAVPTRLVFTTQPSAATLFAQPFAQQPVVRAEDVDGNLGVNFDAATVPGSEVGLTLESQSGTGSLQGVNPVAAVKGVVAFQGLSISSAGVYALNASSKPDVWAEVDSVLSDPSSIGRATPTVRVADAGGTYNGAAFEAVAEVAGVDGVFSGSLEGVEPIVTYYAGLGVGGDALGVVAPTAAGTYTAVARFPGSVDYGPAGDSAVFTIARAPLTVSADGKAKVYGGADPTLTYTVLGLVPGDAASVVSGVALSTATGAEATAGTHAIRASGGTAANYVVSDVDGSLDVSRAGLTIAADSRSTKFGAAVTELTATYTGFVYDDSPASLTTPVRLSTPVTDDCPAGSYPIVASGADSPNYSVRYVDGVMTVEPYVPPANPVVRAADAYIATIYVDVLGRQPEPSGLDFWMSRTVADRSPLKVFQSLSRSPERIALVRSGQAPKIPLRVAYANALRAARQSVVRQGAVPAGPAALARWVGR
ncbi:MBG domain-containing protein [Paludisphaera mucosa]|uniref:MBG domain-containing protein n=1 Tax=Paludisphaera mucosa TaxID=3030827 RepID=A0ABT6FG78_9BACT|nr:MBG domain-containing protein [Paludisphaera mucosa]MDG3006403.1 MBG domain-containing protein [Paludisphaera mucosa]